VINVDEVKKKYKEGMRLKLLEDMPEDFHPILKGETGTITGVDDMGNILMRWDNGRTLSVLPDVDSFIII